MKKPGSCALLRRQRSQRRRHVGAGGVGEHHALGDLARQCHHLPAQRRDDDRRQGAQALLRAKFLHEVADVAQRLAGCDAHADMRRPVRHADPQPEPAARHLVHHRGTLGEVADRALVDRRDRGAERHAGRVPGQRLAQRHVAEHAGRVDAGETAPLDLLRDFDGAAAAAGNGDEADGGQDLGHGTISPLITPRGYRAS